MSLGRKRTKHIDKEKKKIIYLTPCCLHTFFPGTASGTTMQSWLLINVCLRHSPTLIPFSCHPCWLFGFFLVILIWMFQYLAVTKLRKKKMWFYVWIYVAVVSGGELVLTWLQKGFSHSQEEIREMTSIRFLPKSGVLLVGSRLGVWTLWGTEAGSGQAQPHGLPAMEGDCRYLLWLRKDSSLGW